MTATSLAPTGLVVAERSRHLRNALAGLVAGLYTGIMVGLLRRPAK